MSTDTALTEVLQRIEDLEDYKPVINERLADNELAIQKLEERLEVQLGKPSGDIEQLENRFKQLALQQENLQNAQLSMTRVKLIVEDGQQDLIE